jgi:predicted porin
LAEVTVYGTVDAGLANTSFSGAGTEGVGTGTYLSGAGGYSAGNNIGFKGSEDLGGGLSVNFTLQTGFSLGQGRPDNGGAGQNFQIDNTAAANTAQAVAGNQPLFNQVSTVGLSGEFGSVNLGQQLSPFIATAAGGALGNGHFWVNRLILGNGVALPPGATNFGYGGFFIPNAISYSLPAGLPVTGSLLTNTRNGSGQNNDMTLPAGQLAQDGYTAFNLGTSVGSINLGFAHEARSNTYKNWIATASTNIGELQLAGSYMNSRRDPLVTAAAENSFGSMSVSAGYNVTPEFNATIQYARNGDGLLGAAPTLTAFTGKYTLSKRTSLYASYIKASDGARSNYDLRGAGVGSFNGAEVGQSNSTAVAGIAHSF